MPARSTSVPRRSVRSTSRLALGGQAPERGGPAAHRPARPGSRRRHPCLPAHGAGVTAMRADQSRERLAQRGPHADHAADLTVRCRSSADALTPAGVARARRCPGCRAPRSRRRSTGRRSARLATARLLSRTLSNSRVRRPAHGVVSVAISSARRPAGVEPHRHELHAAAESTTPPWVAGLSCADAAIGPAAAPGGCAHAAMIASATIADLLRTASEVSARPAGHRGAGRIPSAASATMVVDGPRTKGRWRDAWHGWARGAHRRARGSRAAGRSRGAVAPRALAALGGPGPDAPRAAGRGRQASGRSTCAGRPTGQALSASCARPTKRWPPRWSRRRRPIPSSARRGERARDDLARELERLASADIRASRGPDRELRAKTRARPTSSPPSASRQPRTALSVRSLETLAPEPPSSVSARRTPGAATLEFKDATKRYPGTDEAAVDSLSLEVPGRRDLRAGRALRAAGRPRPCGWSTA